MTLEDKINYIIEEHDLINSSLGRGEPIESWMSTRVPWSVYVADSITESINHKLGLLKIDILIQNATNEQVAESQHLPYVTYWWSRFHNNEYSLHEYSLQKEWAREYRRSSL